MVMTPLYIFKVFHKTLILPAPLSGIQHSLELRNQSNPNPHTKLAQGAQDHFIFSDPNLI